MVLATSKISMHICKMLSLQPKKSTKKGENVSNYPNPTHHC